MNFVGSLMNVGTKIRQVFFLIRFNLKVKILEEKLINGKQATLDKEREILDQLKSKGYYVQEDFMDDSDCRAIVEEIDEILAQQGKIWTDEISSDNRIFRAERYSKRIMEFTRSKIGDSIFHKYIRPRKAYAFTMAAKLVSKPGNLGSGRGWHLDSVRKQYKLMVYLTDVDMESGPFQYYEKSHRTWNKLKYMLKNKVEGYTRYDGQNLTDKDLVTFCAKAGTAIFFDTSGLHRGSPITKGERYALTNYYYSKLPPHFSDILGLDEEPLLPQN